MPRTHRFGFAQLSQICYSGSTWNGRYASDKWEDLQSLMRMKWHELMFQQQLISGTFSSRSPRLGSGPRLEA